MNLARPNLKPGLAQQSPDPLDGLGKAFNNELGSAILGIGISIGISRAGFMKSMPSVIVPATVRLIAPSTALRILASR